MLPPVSQCFRVQGPGSCGESGLHPRSLTLGPSEVLKVFTCISTMLSRCVVLRYSALCCYVTLCYVMSCTVASMTVART